MAEPKWLTPHAAEAVQRESITSFGGTPGMRDVGLLEGALDRPHNQWHSGKDPTIYDLAAAYCAGIVNNHPFVDGNKRAGLLAAVAFLGLDGFAFEPDEAQVVAIILGLAAGEIDELAVARWIADNAKSKQP